MSYDDVGLSLLTYKERSEDGFYVFMTAPKQEVSSDEAIGKNVIFVFDTSGSMQANDKIGQARKALEFCVSKLNKQDNFNIIDFSTAVKKFKPSPVSAGSNEIQSALKYIKNLYATGGTNINDALIEAINQLSQAKNPLNMIVFLTDGQPTVGVTNEQTIVKNVSSANKLKARIFVFGVGYDVNTRLLDELANINHGFSSYVKPEDDIEVIVSDFFAKVSNPILSDLSLDFGGINTFDRYPPKLPDLFAGSQIKEFGRYRGSGKTIIKLKRIAEGKQAEFRYNADFPIENTENKFIPRIWATRKVGYLIDQVRKNGATTELIDEIRALSIKYGIVNEYVSMLILEDQPPVPATFANQFADTVGKSAVTTSTEVRKAKESASVQSGAQGENMVIAGDKIFIKRGNIWVDAEHRDKNPTVILQYGSDEYFALLSKYPELGKYFAIGKNVMVFYKGEFYRVQEDSTESPVEIKGKLQGRWGGVKNSTNESEVYKFSLGQNFPNPFNPQTWIPFTLAESSNVTIKIYDLDGNLVRKIDLGHKPAGAYTTRELSALWDGKNNEGESVSSGIYFYMLEAGKFKSIKKMMLKR